MQHLRLESPRGASRSEPRPLRGLTDRRHPKKELEAEMGSVVKVCFGRKGIARLNRKRINRLCVDAKIS